MGEGGWATEAKGVKAPACESACTGFWGRQPWYRVAAKKRAEKKENMRRDERAGRCGRVICVPGLAGPRWCD